MIRICTLALAFAACVCATGSATAADLAVDVTAEGPQPIQFEGWCDIELPERVYRRVAFSGRDDRMETIRTDGLHIDQCLVTKTTGDGTLILTLTEDDVEIARSTAGPGEMSIRFGPTMRRFTSQPGGR